MPLMLNLDKDRQIEISNEHDVFAGTDYAKEKWSVLARPLSSTKHGEIKKRNTGPRGQDENAVDREVFDYCVQSWEGFVTKEGPIECTKENKLRVADKQWSLAGKIVTAIITESQKAESALEDEAKN